MPEDKKSEEQPPEKEYNGPEQEPEQFQEPDEDPYEADHEKRILALKGTEELKRLYEALGILGQAYKILDGYPYYAEKEERSWASIDSKEKREEILLWYEEEAKKVQEQNPQIFDQFFGSPQEEPEELTKEEIDEIKREAQHQRITEYPLQNNFKNLFNQYCYENDLLGEMMYHTLIGMCFKEKKIPDKHGNLTNFNTHIIAIADSGCLHENTSVLLSNFHLGRGMKLKDLDEKFMVLSRNFDTGKDELKEAIKINSGTKEMFRIEFEDGREVLCSADHKFFLPDKTERALSVLKEGNEILARKSAKIKTIKKAGTAQTYDLKVKDNHNFYLGNGILTHNSGKDQACDFLTNFIRELNYTITQHNTQNPEHQIGTFRVFELGGTESVEVFLDHFPKRGGIYETTKTKKDKDGKKKEENIEPINGILSANDLILARECSYLFKEKGGQKQQKIEILLGAMERKSLERTLLSWNGRSTITHANCAFIGTTRPIEDMKAHIVYSGFQQRALNYCVKVQTETREKIVSKLAEEIERTPAQKQKLLDDRKKLAEEFLQMRLWIKDNSMNILKEDQKNIRALVSNRIITLIKQVELEIKSPEYREIFESFIARFHYHAEILAFHNAASRKSFFIEVSDYENALSLIEKTFGLLQDWVTGSIMESKDSQIKWKKFEQTYQQILIQHDKERKGIERKKLNELVSAKLGYSFSFAKTITTNLSRGNYALLEVKKGDQNKPDFIRLRKQDS